MGRKFTSNETSPFYPPRAGWSAGWFRFWEALRRRLALDRIHMPRGVVAGELVAGFLVPGLAVLFRGPRLWGQIALAACAGLMLAYVIWLGYPAANMAFGALISIHVTGFVHYCHHLGGEETFGARLRFTLFVMLSLILLLYLPVRNLVQRELVTPLRINDQVIVVHRLRVAPVIGAGQWVAYSLAQTSQGEAHNGGAVRFQGGAGLARVLAVGGDQVLFSTNGFSVNGMLHPALDHMPKGGEWTVPEKHWFIWPNLAISGHGNVSEAAISSTLLELADVSPSQFLGQPFNRWFWRRQHLP